MVSLLDEIAEIWLSMNEKDISYPEELVQLITDWYAEITRPSLILFYDTQNNYNIICFYLIFEDRYVTHEPAESISWPERVSVILNNDFKHSLVSRKTGTNITSSGYNLNNTILELNPYNIRKAYESDIQSDILFTKGTLNWNLLNSIENIIKYRFTIEKDEHNSIGAIINFLYIKSTIKGLEYLVNGFLYNY